MVHNPSLEVGARYDIEYLSAGFTLTPLHGALVVRITSDGFELLPKTILRPEMSAGE